MGLDFFCEVMDQISSIEEASGVILGVQVKSVASSKSARIAIDRIDAINLLRQQQPTAIFGILVGPDTIHYVLRDKPLIDMLLSFLVSRKLTLTIRIDEMKSDGAHTASELRDFTCPARQRLLQLYIAEQASRRVIPNATIELRQTSDKSVATICAPWIGGAFLVPPKDREDIRTNFFGLGVEPDPSHGISINPHLGFFLALADTGKVMGGIEGEADLQVTNGNSNAKIRVRVRNFGDEWSVTHESGLCLIRSEHRLLQDGRPKLDLYVHWTKGLPLAQTNSYAFFSLLKSGSILSLEGQYWLRVENWGSRLAGVAERLDEERRVSTTLGIDLTTFKLRDWMDTEFVASMFFLKALTTNAYAPDILFPPFVLGDSRPIDDYASSAVTFCVPLVMNVLQKGFIAWLTVRGAELKNDDDTFAGLRFDQINKVELEERGRFTKSKYPELWIRRDLPAIPLGSLPENSTSIELANEYKPQGGIILRFITQSPVSDN